jgi:hypothetical protein
MSDRTDSLPCVYKVDNQYYIAGDGLHRLTMAKCLGGKQVKVIVKKISQIN